MSLDRASFPSSRQGNLISQLNSSPINRFEFLDVNGNWLIPREEIVSDAVKTINQRIRELNTNTNNDFSLFDEDIDFKNISQLEKIQQQTKEFSDQITSAYEIYNNGQEINSPVARLVRAYAALYGLIIAHISMLYGREPESGIPLTTSQSSLRESFTLDRQFRNDPGDMFIQQLSIIHENCFPD
jgi:hypothetical protein